MRGREFLRVAGAGALEVEAPVRLIGPFLVRGATRVGAFTSIADGSEAHVATLGRYCEIAPRVLLGATGHPTTWLSVNSFQYKAATWGWHPAADAVATVDPEAGGRASFRGTSAIIGNDVWIGAGAVVVRDVTVGDGAIIAANAVVTQDVAPYAIVGGVPARPLGQRVPDDVRDGLLELAWWRFSPNQLSGVPFDDLPAAVVELTRRVGDLEPYEPGFERVTPGPVIKPAAATTKRFGRRA